MKVFFTLASLLFSLSAQATLPAGASLSFKGSAALDEVRTGKITRTLRLKDRTQAPYSYVVGKVLPLINSDTSQERRTEEEQVAQGAYGFVEISSIAVSRFADLSSGDQAEFLRYYTQERINEAKGIISIVGIRFRSQNR